MNWDAISAIGEIVGAIAVVITLIYLARQIRDSNRETRAVTLQATASNAIDVNTVFVDNAATWNKVISGIELEDEDEKRKGIVLYNLLMIETEARFHQFEAGYLDATAWERRLPAIRITIKNPIHKSWRASPGANAHSLSFLKMLDEMEKQAEDE